MEVLLSDKKKNIIAHIPYVLGELCLGVILVFIGFGEKVSIIMISLGYFLIAGGIYSLQILNVKHILYTTNGVEINHKVVPYDKLILLIRTKQNWVQRYFWGNFPDGSLHGGWNVYNLYYYEDDEIRLATFVISKRRSQTIIKFVDVLKSKNLNCNIYI